MVETRPRYRPEWTAFQKVLESIGFMAITSMWLFTLYSFSSLPDTIPIHYNAAGKPDGYGERYMVIVLPAILTGVYLLISLVSRTPWHFNYLIRITENNYREQYGAAVHMLRLLKVCIALFGLYVVSNNIRNARGEVSGLDPIALFAFIGSIVFITAFHIFKSTRNK